MLINTAINMEDIEFGIELIIEENNSKYLCGFIRTLNIDFEKLYDLKFLFKDDEDEIIEYVSPPEKVKLRKLTESEMDNCCYFLIEKDELYVILVKNRSLYRKFSIEIDINGKLIQSIESMQYEMFK